MSVPPSNCGIFLSLAILFALSHRASAQDTVRVERTLFVVRVTCKPTDDGFDGALRLVKHLSGEGSVVCLLLDYDAVSLALAPESSDERDESIRREALIAELRNVGCELLVCPDCAESLVLRKRAFRAEVKLLTREGVAHVLANAEHVFTFDRAAKERRVAPSERTSGESS